MDEYISFLHDETNLFESEDIIERISGYCDDIGGQSRLYSTSILFHAEQSGGMDSHHLENVIV